MRKFVSDILCSQPTSSSSAIAAILLDDAGLSPDDLGHGVTVIECEHYAITKAIVPLLRDALLPRKSTTDHYERLTNDEVILVVSSQSRSYVGSAVDKALELDAPVVVATNREGAPA